ncbi:hypothetical protein E3N88_11794 [Mikania micrantha]|uniref:Uncharacterized protein n=1 Tax=Mikania micrantha TaxID=192012 RepID=A0A5N6P6Q1_9ASTR|nr:hypothetical protein E3N88_11794 [Mikania micrantha]
MLTGGHNECNFDGNAGSAMTCGGKREQSSFGYGADRAIITESTTNITGYGYSRTCYGVSMTLLPYSYGVSMVAPVLVTGRKPCAKRSYGLSGIAKRRKISKYETSGLVAVRDGEIEDSSRNLSSEIINNINYLMTIKAMSLTLDVQKDSISKISLRSEKVRKGRGASKLCFSSDIDRGRGRNVVLPAAVGQNLSTAVEQVMMEIGWLVAWHEDYLFKNWHSC